MKYLRCRNLSRKVFLISLFIGNAHFARAGVISEAPSLVELFVNGLQIVLTVVSIIAVIALVISGVMYISAGGDERSIERAKKMLVGSIAGLVIALLSLVIVQVLTQLVS